jgi:PAS domain S-box-containing protein
MTTEKDHGTSPPLSELDRLRCRVAELEAAKRTPTPAEEVQPRRERHLQEQDDVLLSLMSRGILFRADLRSAIQEITEACSDLIGTERISVWLYDEGYATVRCIDIYDRSARRHTEGEELNSSEFPSYTSSHRRGAVVAATDVYNDPRTRDIPAAYFRKHDIRSLLDAPVWLHDRVGGLLSFEQTGSQRSWSQEDERLSISMAALVSLCFEANDRRRAEKALRESEAMLSSLFQAAPVGIAILDAERHFRAVNERVCQMLGYSREELVLQDTRKAYPSEEEYDRVGRELYADLRLRGAATNEVRLQRKDGTELCVLMSAAMLEPEDASSGLVVTVLDVTERKRAEQEKDFLQQQLNQAQKMEAIGQLASGVAHDFSNLLTVMFANIDAIKQELTPDQKPTVDKRLESLREAAQQAVGVTQSLLMFARNVPAEKKRIDFRETVERTARMIRRVLPASIELVVEAADQTPIWVNADETQIQQIIMNLTVNARDAMPDGGTLRVAVSSVADRQPADPAASRSPEGSCACMTVSDTGAGMPPEVQARIFEPFFTTKPGGRGTGLGLSIVHGIVEKHSGRIEVDSARGRGTTFKVFLPRAEPRVRPIVPRVGQNQTPGTGEQILLAEDSEYLAAILATRLQSEGYCVIKARSGEALSEAHRQHGESVRLLLFGGGFAKRSGIDCLRDLRAKGSRTPAILMAGSTDSVSAASLPENTHLLRKPFQIAELMSLISCVLNAETIAEW